MNERRLYVVITDFNGWQQTRTCLQQLEASTYRGYQVIVVDHGTSDETAKGLKAFSSCVHLQGSPDIWWTGATNLGVREALARGATHIMLLNNDCFLEESTLSEIMSNVSDNAATVLAPVQRSASSGEVLVARASTCFTLGFPTMILPHMRAVSAADDRRLPTKLIVGGRGAVIPVSVFDQIGLFDEDALPHYGADHDFYLRCRANGIPLFLVPRASVSIDETRTSVARDLGKMNWRQFRASLHAMHSHRNIDALRTLFHRYYPLRVLYPLGLYLNLGRYFISYAIQRVVSRF